MYASGFGYGATAASSSTNGAVAAEKFSDLCRKCAVQEWLHRHQNSLAIAEHTEQERQEEEAGLRGSGGRNPGQQKNGGGAVSKVCKSVHGPLENEKTQNQAN